MKTGKNMSKRIVKLLIAVSVCLLLTGCVNTGAHIVPSVTIPPESTQPPEPTPSPTPEPVQVEEMADLSSAYDRNGLLIVGEEHFQQYISFKNIQVYEQCGDTFMDAVAVNEYPDTLVCALNILFFDEDGNFMPEKTDKVLSERLAKTERAVIPGFYGAKEDGTIKTFSRGGSDITGSIVSRAVRATCYENWTDVSGFLIADPRIIDNPKPIKTITYRELRELSYMGAGVLHEDAVFPVRKAGIPINIRNTNAPEDEGTWIVESTCHQSKYTITGIAGKKGFVSVNIDKDMMNSEIGFGRKVLSAFEDNGISFEHMPSGIDTMTIFVHQPEFEGKEQVVISAIHRYAQPDSIELESDLALIAVVGRGMKSQRGTAGRVFSALAHAHVNVKMIDQGSSELNIIIGVREHDFEAAIKAIYDIFVNTQL